MRAIQSKLHTLAAALTLLIPGLGQSLDSTLPSLTIKKGTAAQRLEIRDLNVEVECIGHLAEITFDINYYNGSNRNQEGEFNLKLPVGSKVSAYFLEVNDKLRAATSVESEKALNAYETIKRRGVDPGIVEKIGETSYRTRIFPILPKSTKRVRISYTQRLPESGQFPLTIQHDSEVESFRIDVRGTRRIKVGDDNVDDAPESPLNFSITGEQTKPDYTLLLQSERSPFPSYRAFHDEHNRVHFLVQGDIPDQAPSKPLSWPSLRLIWDASRSRSIDDKDAELKALRDLWKTLGSVEVSLQILQKTLFEPELFSIKKGNASDLEEAIRNISYDGVADFSVVSPSPVPTLLISDGQVASPVFRPEETSRPNQFLLSLPNTSPDSTLTGSGFKIVKLGEKNWVRGLLTPPRVYQINELSDDDWTVTEQEDRFFLTGRYDKERIDDLTIKIAGSPSIAIRETSEAEEWNLLRRFHSLQKLEDLEKQGLKEKIVHHAKRERLASDFTSLIVLEEFRDHITFEIPPPEKDLLKKYKIELRQKKKYSLSRARRAWDTKRSNHAESDIWIDYQLQAELDTVSIWLNSSKKLFPKEKRNQREIKPYEKWVDQSREVLDRKEDLKTGKDIAAWMKGLNQQVDALEKLRTLPAIPHGENAIHVSVRGFVKNRGILSEEGQLSLNKAIREMGGTNHYGSLRRVFLYRNASRTGYNMKNPEFVPVTLQWGDMVVVESEPVPNYPYADGFAVDAFADPFMAAPAGGNSSTPAVFEENGIARASQGSRSTPAAGADPFGGGTGRNSTGSNDDRPVPTVATTLNVALPRGLDEEVIATFQSSEDLEETYQTWLEKTSSRASLTTIVEVARVLFQGNETELGKQCLLNLIELQDNPIEATRSLAFWFCEFGFEREATFFLTSLLESPLDTATRELLHHDLGRISSSAGSFQSSIKEGIKEKRAALVMNSLVDLFRLGGIDPTGQFEQDPMNSDLRIVISTAGGNLIPEVEEPAEATKWRDWGVTSTRSDRVSELLIRRAWPGVHQVSGRSWEKEDALITARIEIYTNWGRDSQKVIKKTLWVEDRGVTLGEIDFTWE